MAKVQGKGSIQALEKPERTCKRWRIRVNTGYDPIKKRYTQVTRIVHGSKRKAQQELRKLIEEVESGRKLKLARTTFAAYAEQWLEERKLSGNISKGTLRKNDADIKKLTPFAGEIEIGEFDADNITRLLIKVKNEGGKRVSQYSGTTMNGVYRVLYQILEDARKKKLILTNPCDDVVAPKKDTKEKEALPINEARRLAETLLSGDPEARTVGFLLALSCGLRREEAVGLRWLDFDPRARCIRVENAYSADDLELTDPKSRASHRIVPLTGKVCERLIAWKSLQAKKLLSLGIRQTAETPIVCTRDGDHMHPQNFARAWSRYAKDHGFGGYTLHQLRHTFATRLVAKGVDLKTAATLMGHSGVGMLEAIYAHFVPENAEIAIGLLDEDLFSSKQAPIVPFSDIAKSA